MKKEKANEYFVQICNEDYRFKNATDAAYFLADKSRKSISENKVKWIAFIIKGLFKFDNISILGIKVFAI